MTNYIPVDPNKFSLKIFAENFCGLTHQALPSNIRIMPDTPSSDQNPNLPPPSGDPRQAEKYINQLIELIENARLDVIHTDLAKFDPSALQDHYSLELKEYRVEVSHSKYPQSGKDSYIILFTNIQNISEGNFEKIILAYMHLDESQFAAFKKASFNQIERRRRAEEEKRLKETMVPIDQILEQLTSPPAAPFAA